MLSNLVNPVITAPALYKFEFFQNGENRERWKMHESVKEWRWHSACELRQACKAHIDLQLAALAVEDRSPWEFDFIGYASLNSTTNLRSSTQLSWFIADGEGYVANLREAECCPFSDPRLYFPAKFGLRVLKAVEAGISRTKWNGAVLSGTHYLTGKGTDINYILE